MTSDQKPKEDEERSVIERREFLRKCGKYRPPAPETIVPMDPRPVMH